MSKLINVNGSIVRVVFTSLMDYAEQVAELFAVER